VRVSVASPDKVLASTAANVYALSYVDFRRTKAANDTLAASKQVDTKVQAIQKQLDEIDAKIDKLMADDAARQAADPKAKIAPSDALPGLRVERQQVTQQRLLFAQNSTTSRSTPP